MKLLVGIVFAAGLLAPILYAVDTLSRMRNKRVYPLIRLQRADGLQSALEVKRGKQGQSTRHNVWTPVEDTSSPERRIA